MIIEALVNIILIPINFLLGFLPDFSWTIQLATGSVFFQLFRVACYILPVGTIILIFNMVIALTIIRIVIAFIKFLTNLLPFL